MSERMLGVALGLALLATGAGWAQQAPEYLHTIYYVGLQPTAYREGKCVCDLSTRERVFDIIGELSALGVNAVCYHSVYGSDGALYPTDDPMLRRSWRWPEDDRPVDDFLTACEQFGVQAWLGVHLGSGGHPLLAQHAQDDILRHFGESPTLAGIVPPIEGRYTGITAPDFIDLSACVKRARPDLGIMDYPSSPYAPQALHWLMRLARSGQVDIENVQFHACDDRLEDLREARGLTLLTMGACPGIRTIIHTHYKNGVNTPDKPTEWLPPERAWDVSRSAIITATPDGTSIFSFLHGFWGEQSSDPGGDSMWRRLKWYEGIVGVQRLLPMYAGAQPDASVQVMIPAGTMQGAQDILAQCWEPLARAHVPATFCADRTNLSPGARALIVPAFAHCDTAQGTLLQRFVTEGGTLLAVGGMPLLEERYARLLAAGELTAHLREVLDLSEEPPVSAQDLDPSFAQALGFADGALAEVVQPRTTDYGRGRVTVLPSAREWADAHLPETVSAALADGWRVEGLPEGCVIERWRKGDTRMLLIMGIREGLEATDVRVTLPERCDRAWQVQGESAGELPLSTVGDRQQLTIARLGDSPALVVLGDCPQPLLRPEALTVRGKVGETVKVAASVLNITGAHLTGEVSAEAPEGWQVRPDVPLRYDQEPGWSTRYDWDVTIPADAQRRPHFVKLRAGALLQRVIVFPEDGAPQVITERDGPLILPRPAAEAGPIGLIADEWLSVTAGQPGDNAVAAHRPGVCFYAGEWSHPREQDGSIARYGELIPVGMAGPNFWINDPDRREQDPRDLLLRLTYIAPQGGRVQVYDGAKYHDIGDLQPGEIWRTDTWTVSRHLFAPPEADYGRNHPGFNVLGQFSAPAVYVHELQVRMAPAAEEE